MITNTALKTVADEMAQAYVYGGRTPAGNEVIPQILGGKQINEIREIADVRRILPEAVVEMKKALQDFDFKAFTTNLGTIIGTSLAGSKIDAFETAAILAASTTFSEIGSQPDAVWYADILARNAGGGISGALSTGDPDRACDRIVDTVAVAAALATENPQEVVKTLLQGTASAQDDWASLPRVIWKLPEHLGAITTKISAVDRFKGFEEEFRVTLGIAIAGEYFITAREVEAA